MIIVADNGSKDSSVQISIKVQKLAWSMSPIKDTGAALIGGISEAKAPFILMADADDSYDFLETHYLSFLETQRGL